MPGTLYIVATPIGNLADASPRSLEVLGSVGLVACEDTRTSRTLLARHGIATRTVALHEHNEQEASEKLIEVLQRGTDVALVSDAGTPGLSDPGALVVALAHRAGLRVIAVPGPSAAMAAWSAAGVRSGRFLFAGFLPASGAARREAIAELPVALPVILYESPHRVLQTVADLLECFGAEREIVIARELSKKFEEIVRCPLGAARAWLEGESQRIQGEFVLVLEAGARVESDALAEGERVLNVLLEALAPSEAAKLAAKITGAPKNLLYRRALAGKK